MINVISSESIAHRYAVREGCRYINYRDVAIAIFQMDLRVFAIESRDVSPIVEFLLKFMLQGIDTMDMLAGFLGLDEELVHEELLELRRKEFIELSDFSANDESVSFRLTERGKEIADDLKSSSVKEVTYPYVYVHGLLRKPINIGKQEGYSYYNKRQAENRDYSLIRPLPKKPPRSDEIDVNILSNLHEKKSHKSKKSLELISIQSILKPVRTLYEHAVMIEYETMDAEKSRQVTFVVDGVPKPEYEFAFYEQDGEKKLPQLFSEKGESFEDRISKGVSQEVVESLGSIGDPEQDAIKVASLEEQIDVTEKELRIADRTDTKKLMQADIDRLRKELADTKATRDNTQLKYLNTVELKQKLHEAIDICEERLLILSGFISRRVVDNQFINKLRKALDRGVKIWVGYGFGKFDTYDVKRENPDWYEAENALNLLAKEYPKQLIVRDTEISHEKRVICDNKFCMGGSYNYLSFRGKKAHYERKIRREGADLIENAAYCEELYTKYQRELFN